MMSGSSWKPVRLALALVTLTLLFGPGVISPAAAAAAARSTSGTDTRRQHCPTSLSKCECATDEGEKEVTIVNCTNIGFTDPLVLADMPKSVRQIIFVGNNISELPQNLMGESPAGKCRQMSKLNFLDLSRNNVRSIAGKTFHCMGSLKELILDENNWFIDREDHPRVFSGLHSLTNLSLRHAFARQYNGTIQHITKLRNLFREGNLTKLQDLDISDNDLWIFSTDAFNELPNLVRLRINNNFVANPRINYANLTKLEELQMSNNSIAFLAASFMETLSNKFPSLKHVNISDNPFQCDCNQIKTFEWLISKKSPFVVDKDQLKCDTPESMFNKTILSLSKNDFKCPKPVDMDSKLRASYVIIGCIFAVMGIVFIAVMILNRYKIMNTCNSRIVEPIREALIDRDVHHSQYTSVNV